MFRRLKGKPDGMKACIVQNASQYDWMAAKTREYRETFPGTSEEGVRGRRGFPTGGQHPVKGSHGAVGITPRHALDQRDPELLFSLPH